MTGVESFGVCSFVLTLYWKTCDFRSRAVGALSIVIGPSYFSIGPFDILDAMNIFIGIVNFGSFGDFADVTALASPAPSPVILL